MGGLAVQFVINGYGFLFVAGFTATNKLYGVLEMAAISYGYAVVSYVGQNLGAGEITRIKKGVHASSFLAFLTSAFISIVMFLFGKTLLSMFISGDPEQTSQVLAIAWHYLSIMASCLCILYFLYVLIRSALQGLGKYHDSDVERSGRIFLSVVGVALFTTETDWSEWDFLCRDCSVDRSCCFADDQLLYQHSQICLMHENLL